MDLMKLKVAMASALRNALGVDASALPTELRPSAYLAREGLDLDTYLAQAREEIQARVWTGELLPHGYPAPADAVPGAAYYIITSSGSVIFQYLSSPYAPETPGLAPGALTPENVQAAMEAHVQALAEALAVERLTQNYLEWLAGQML